MNVDYGIWFLKGRVAGGALKPVVGNNKLRKEKKQIPRFRNINLIVVSGAVVSVLSKWGCLLHFL